VLLGRKVPHLGDAKYHTYRGVKCCTDEMWSFALGRSKYPGSLGTMLKMSHWLCREWSKRSESDHVGFALIPRLLTNVWSHSFVSSMFVAVLSYSPIVLMLSCEGRGFHKKEWTNQRTNRPTDRPTDQVEWVRKITVHSQKSLCTDKRVRGRSRYTAG